MIMKKEINKEKGIFNLIFLKALVNMFLSQKIFYLQLNFCMDLINNKIKIVFKKLILKNQMKIRKLNL
jgi:hypothetical protein